MFKKQFQLLKYVSFIKNLISKESTMIEFDLLFRFRNFKINSFDSVYPTMETSQFFWFHKVFYQFESINFFGSNLP